MQDIRRRVQPTSKTENRMNPDINLLMRIPEHLIPYKTRKYNIRRESLKFVSTRQVH